MTAALVAWVGVAALGLALVGMLFVVWRLYDRLDQAEEALAERCGCLEYGHAKTWHRTGTLDVEVDRRGRVVAVWFRCRTLPFTEMRVDDARAESMRAIYAERQPEALVAVHLAAAELGQ